MKISVIIPALNEETRIVSTLEQVGGFLEQHDINAEIITVDDGSTDATEFVSHETLRRRHTPYKVIRHKTNAGKGAAIATGIKHSTGDYILFLDADGSTNIKELKRFFTYINPATLLIGSRQKNKNLILIDQGYGRKILGFFTQLFHKIFFRLPVLDSQCGFKLLPKSLAISFIRKPYPKRFGFDIALIDYALKCGFEVEEIGVEWKDISGSNVRPFVDIFKTAFELLIYKINSLKQ